MSTDDLQGIGHDVFGQCVCCRLRFRNALATSKQNIQFA